jgi:hypothetical protein
MIDWIADNLTFVTIAGGLICAAALCLLLVQSYNDES